MRAGSANKKHIFKGWLSETLALFFLLSKGYTPIARNIKTPYGETDILARKGDVICVIEVKYRQSRSKGHVAIRPAQQKRLINQGVYYHKKYKTLGIRFDAVFLFPHWPFIEHIKAVWEA